MKTLMTVAAGAAIGYFLYQYFAGSAKSTVNMSLGKPIDS